MTLPALPLPRRVRRRFRPWIRLRPTRRALSRRTTLQRAGVFTTSTYDPASQLATLEHRRTSDQTRLQHFTLTYDPAGNRTSQTTLAGTDTYTYDALNRLTSATHPTQPPERYTYDAVGNRRSSHLSTTHRYDAANRLLEDATFMYEYDLNGNLTTKSDKTTGEVTIFTYDAQDQLLGVTRAIPPFVPTLTVDYRYDALGRRVLKTVNGVTVVFLYDQEDLVAILDPTGTPSQVVHHGPGIDEPLFLHEPQSGETLTYLADPLGSIILLVRPDGSVASTQLFDAFGRRIAHAGIVSQPYTFTGREHDPETGLIYFRSRYYDPQIGRFIQEDPAGFSGGLNLYAYVENNPVIFADPFGLRLKYVGTPAAQRILETWVDQLAMGSPFAKRAIDEIRTSERLFVLRVASLKRFRSQRDPSIETSAVGYTAPLPTPEGGFILSTIDLAEIRLTQREGIALSPQEVVAHELIGHAWAHNRSGGLQGHESFAEAVQRRVSRDLKVRTGLSRTLNGLLQEGK